MRPMPKSDEAEGGPASRRLGVPGERFLFAGVKGQVQVCGVKDGSFNPRKPDPKNPNIPCNPAPGYKCTVIQSARVDALASRAHG